MLRRPSRVFCCTHRLGAQLHPTFHPQGGASVPFPRNRKPSLYDVGDALERARRALGLTLKQHRAATNIHESVQSQWENGRPGAKLGPVVTSASFLKMDVRALLLDIESAIGRP